MRSFVIREKNDLALVVFLSVICIFSSIIIEYIYALYLKDIEHSDIVSDNTIVLSVNSDNEQLIDMSFLQNDKYDKISVFAKDSFSGFLTYKMFLCDYVDFDIVSGRSFCKTDFSDSNNVAIIGSDVTNLEINDIITNKKEYTIVGVFKSKDTTNIKSIRSDNMKIYFCANEMKLNPSKETELFIKADDRIKAQKFVHRISSVLSQKNLTVYEKDRSIMPNNFISSRKLSISLSLSFFSVVVFAELFAILLWIMMQKRLIMVYNILGKQFIKLRIFIKGLFLNIIAIGMSFSYIVYKKLNIFLISKWIVALYVLLYIICFTIAILLINTSFIRKMADRENDE